MQFNGRSFPMSLEARKVVYALVSAGGEPYVVGGSVREFIMDHDLKDYDMEVYKLNSDQIIKAVGGLGAVSLAGNSFPVIKLRMPSGMVFDISIPRRETKTGPLHTDYIIEADPSMTLAEACLRRDFTINAGMYDPINDRLIDLHGTVRDITLRLLRPTSFKFGDDALRVLRGMQLAGRDGLKFVSSHRLVTQSMRPDYDFLKRERIWEEWFKWASLSRYPSHGIEFLIDTDWIVFYPELQNLIGCHQDKRHHPEGDAFIHTMLTLDEMARICKENGVELGSEEYATLMFSILLHDIGKPATTFVDTDGGIKSPGHDQLGAKMVAGFMEKTGRVNPDQKSKDSMVNNIETLVANHMRHIGLKSASKRSVRRLALDVGNLQHLAYVVEADNSGRRPLAGGLPPQMKAIMEVAKEVNLETEKPKPFLRGDALIALGMKQGKGIGILIAKSFEAQLDGEFEDAEGALAWARENMEGVA